MRFDLAVSDRQIPKQQALPKPVVNSGGSDSRIAV